MVNDLDSLSAAVKNHQGAGKNAIQLFVVKNSGKAEIMPELMAQTVNTCLDITNLPKMLPK